MITTQLTDLVTRNSGPSGLAPIGIVKRSASNCINLFADILFVQPELARLQIGRRFGGAAEGGEGAFELLQFGER